MTEWLLRHFIKNNENITDTTVRTAYGSLAGRVGIVCNLVLVAGKLTAGFFSGSVSIMADGLNNLSDAASSVITLAGFKIASKTADKEHPFGHARFEYIAGLTVAVMVLVMGIELGKSSLEKIIHPTPVTFSLASFAVLAAAVLLKVWMSAFNRNVGQRINSAALQAASADSRNDSIATTAVLLAAAVSRFAGVNLDGWMGLGVAAFIVYSGIGLVKGTLNPLLGEAPAPELVKHVADKIAGYEGVLGTHDLIVHDYGPGHRFASAHVEMSIDVDALVSHDIIDNIERDILENDNIHLIIHYDPIVTGEQMNNARVWIEQQVKTINDHLSIHDLRLIDGPSHTNYVFDVLVPPEFEMPEETLRQRIEEAVQRGDKPIHIVVTIDYSYAATLK
ncbi:MAG TPA: cation diffusion facilitator family transporter [Smithellaceae bacterium]|nr:cation diffusion facilitator family transporter [Smithellaceae bacterium]